MLWYGIFGIQFYSIFVARAVKQSQAYSICQWREPYQFLGISVFVGHYQFRVNKYCHCDSVFDIQS